MNSRRIMACLGLSGWILGAAVSAFAAPRQHHRHQDVSMRERGGVVKSPSTISSTTRLRAGGGGDDFSELTSALARLDQQWKIQQRSKSKSRWSKLMLPQDGPVTEIDPTSGSSNSQDFVWVLEPPSNSIPSCAIVFTGGAGLGQFPHIAYNELLSRVSNRLNAVCIAAPYQVGLDHFGLAKQTGERIRRALVYCEDDSSRQYPPNMPTYCLAHSLGCKLQTIYLGATGQQFEGVGFMSFNNFSFGQTISMARMFADQIRKNTQAAGSGAFQTPSMDNDELLNTIFAFAENIVGAIGVDFNPNAPDTERLIQMRFDDVLQEKTRLFCFDEDNLDNSKEFVANCSGGRGPSASGLPGGHLAPVYFKLGVDDLDLGDVPPEAMDMAKEAVGGFQSASFGSEADLDKLVDEICGWVLGKPPTREPRWDSKARNETPQLAGFSSDDDDE